MSQDHFEGKSVIDHLKAARTKGALASQEVHGTEMSGHMAAGADAARETAVVIFLITWSLWTLGVDPSNITKVIAIFGTAWLIWKTGRSALLGWSRLERLHRLIEEERYEIQHNRAQEKEELREMYEIKGFSGKLLDQVVDTLMADDNRLLKVMLEEELGLTLEVYEHPLKQASGAAIGVIVSALLTFFGWHFFEFPGLIIGGVIPLIASTYMTAKIERNRLLQSLLWIIATTALTAGVAYFVVRVVSHG